MTKRKTKNNFSLESIKRLGIYLRNLRRLKETGVTVISSNKITNLLNVSPEQFRKDLSYFGGFGKRGVGYNVVNLIEAIENILGVNKEWAIAMIGVGKLGGALLGFEGFSRFNINITNIFDSDEVKIGKVKKNIRIEDVKNLKKVIKTNSIKVAILTTPVNVAQSTVDVLVSAGIKGILNFVPLTLKVPDTVAVSNVDMACELESLIFFSKKK